MEETVTVSAAPARSQHVYTLDEIYGVREGLGKLGRLPRPPGLSPYYCRGEPGNLSEWKPPENDTRFGGRAATNPREPRERGNRGAVRERKGKEGWPERGGETRLRRGDEEKTSDDSIILSPPRKLFPSSQLSPTPTRKNTGDLQQEHAGHQDKKFNGIQRENHRDSQRDNQRGSQREQRDTQRENRGERMGRQPISVQDRDRDRVPPAKKSQAFKERERRTNEEFNFASLHGFDGTAAKGQQKNILKAQEHVFSGSIDVDSLFAPENAPVLNPLDADEDDTMNSSRFGRWFIPPKEEKEPELPAQPAPEPQKPTSLLDIIFSTAISEKQVPPQAKPIEREPHPQSPIHIPRNKETEFTLPQQVPVNPQETAESISFITSLLSKGRSNPPMPHHGPPEGVISPSGPPKFNLVQAQNKPHPFGDPYAFQAHPPPYAPYPPHLPPQHLPPPGFPPPMQHQFDPRLGPPPPGFVPSGPPIQDNRGGFNGNPLEKWFGSGIYHGTESALPPMPPPKKMMSLEEVERAHLPK